MKKLLTFTAHVGLLVGLLAINKTIAARNYPTNIPVVTKKAHRPKLTKQKHRIFVIDKSVASKKVCTNKKCYDQVRLKRIRQIK